MKYIPGTFDDYARANGWTEVEKIAFIALTYLDIATYGLLLWLVVRNIWVILYK